RSLDLCGPGRSNRIVEEYAHESTKRKASPTRPPPLLFHFGKLNRPKSASSTLGGGVPTVKTQQTTQGDAHNPNGDKKIEEKTFDHTDLRKQLSPRRIRAKRASQEKTLTCLRRQRHRSSTRGDVRMLDRWQTPHSKRRWGCCALWKPGTVLPSVVGTSKASPGGKGWFPECSCR